MNTPGQLMSFDISLILSIDFVLLMLLQGLLGVSSYEQREALQ